VGADKGVREGSSRLVSGRGDYTWKLGGRSRRKGEREEKDNSRWGLQERPGRNGLDAIEERKPPARPQSHVEEGTIAHGQTR